MRITYLISTVVVACCLVAGAKEAKTQLGSSDVVRVKGVGTGESKEAALKDAYRDAVESAVGMFVDAEQLVDNDQLVRDKILTHSNAYIERYEEKKVSTNDGMVKVVILAEVRRGELSRKLRDVMPTVTLNVSGDSRNLYAQIVTQDKRDATAEELLKDAFDKFDPLVDLMKVSVVNSGSPEVSPAKASDDAKVLSYQLKFQIDSDRYFKVWAPRMNKILSQISLSPGKPFDFNRHKEYFDAWEKYVPKSDYYGYWEKYRTEFFSYGEIDFMCARLLDADRLILGRECKSRNGDSNAENCLGHIYRPWDKKPPCDESDLRCIRRWNGVPKMKAKSKLYAALVMRANQRSCSGMLYELSDRSSAVISDWMSQYSGLSNEREYRNTSARATIYRASLKDASGEELASGNCRAFNHDMSNVGCICWNQDCWDRERNNPGNTIPYVIYMTPWVGCFAGECSTWIDVEIEKDDIAKIETISVSAEAAAKTEKVLKQTWGGIK